MQLDYYKLLAKTSSYILSFIYKARKRVISKDSTPTTYKQVLKLPRDERSKWLEAITKEFIQLLELGVFKFLPRSLLPFNRKLITCRNVLKVKKDAKNRPIKYKSQLVARGFMQVEGLDYTITYASTRAFLNSALREEIYMEIPKGLSDLAASNKAIYKLLLKYGYNPSTPNIIKLSKALYSLKQSPRERQDKLKILLKSLGYLPLISDPGVFYNAKTCHFIVTYVDNYLFIGPNIGYITDLKKRLNKVYAIEDLGPAAYFLGMQIIRDRPNRRLWLNQLHSSSSNNNSSSSSNNSSSSSSNNSSSISSTSSNNCINADSIPLNSKGLIVRIYILLKQAAILWRKEEAEEEAARKTEIAIYKARLSKRAKHALPILLAVKKRAYTVGSNTGSGDSKFVV
ncbi:hypothetical protein P8C59_005185 [Phyllachora maydis]|uniref:Reverse transcriptase Ty1/copia-type domain-containing protein n=1 Tax=Phyllachora maydis TaxID=1825666 RepID=A0AAD9MD85_9PEZI|nr:hypothetical protein P8C59_005185 [Phyllachora maydis]